MKSGTSATSSHRALNADLDATLPQFQSLVGRLADQMIAKLAADVEISVSAWSAWPMRCRTSTPRTMAASRDSPRSASAARCWKSCAAATTFRPAPEKQQHSIEATSVGEIKALPERELHVLSMLYKHDMNLKEIAALLWVDESRLCELHSASVTRLRVKLPEPNGPPALASMCK